MKLLIVFTFSLLVIALSQASECGPNEEYRQCKPCAAISCGDPTPGACIQVCQNPGCYCIAGHLRKNGRCVPTNTC